MDDEDIIIEEDQDDFEETGFEGEELIIEHDEADAQEENNDNEEDENSTLTFQIYHGRIRNKFDGLPAMEQAIDKILKTERFVYPIYSDQYGNDLYDLIGEDRDYAVVEVERMITEALEADDRVEDVEVDTIEPLENNKLAVKGRCSTVYGDIAIDEEVNLNNES